MGCKMGLTVGGQQRVVSNVSVIVVTATITKKKGREDLVPVNCRKLGEETRGTKRRR